jgi:hypothetical protein
MCNARDPLRLPIGDRVPVPFDADSSWYRSYWYESERAQAHRPRSGTLIGSILSILTTAMHLSASLRAGGPCKPLGD